MTWRKLSMAQEDDASRVDEDKGCFVCGKRATKLVISDFGIWKLCEEKACWEALTESKPTERLTWITRPLPEEPEDFS